jgi:ATP-dependent Lon protease
MDAPTEQVKTLADDALILVASDTVLFPGVVMPLAADRPAAATALQQAAQDGGQVAIVLQRDPAVETPTFAELHPIGTEARLLRYVTGRDGTHHAIVHGIGRVRLVRRIEGLPYPAVAVERIPEPQEANTAIAARAHQLRERALETLKLIEQAPPELVATIRNLDPPGALADLVTSLLDLSAEEKQAILETVDLRARLDAVLWRLAYRLEVLRLSSDIGDRTRQTMQGRQREFMLRERLKQIQKELGEEEGGAPELADLRRALEAAGLPEEVERQAQRELRRLERMPEGGPESGMVRTYLEWLSELPWKLGDEKPIDIAMARRVLDEDHFDLEKIIGAEPCQRPFAGCQCPGASRILRQNLGNQESFAAPPADGFADNHLGFTAAVHFGRVDMVHA